MENKILKAIVNVIMRIGNILIGIPIAFGTTIVVLSVCLVNLILCLLPVFLGLSLFIQEIDMGLGPNNFIFKVAAVIVGTCMGFALYKLLKVYIPKYFKGLEWYMKKSLYIENL